MMRSTTKKTDIAWAAGLLDGEGCVDLDVPKRWNLRVSITITNLPAAKRFSTVIGFRHGCLTRTVRPNRKPIFKVRWHGEYAYNALVRLYPYLTVKKAEAKLGIALYKTRLGKKWVRFTNQEKARWIAAHKKMKQLKRRTF